MDYPEMVSCRMTSGDLDRLTASAQRAGMARSEYLRTLIRIPASASGKGAVYVIDSRTMAKMLSELIRWGRHYNQAVRALNTIALFIRRGARLSTARSARCCQKPRRSSKKSSRAAR